MPHTVKYPNKQKNGKNAFQKMVEDGTWPERQRKLLEGQKISRENKLLEKLALEQRVRELEDELNKRLQ